MAKKYKVGYTAGVFDLFHIGHLNILRKAKEQCDYLIVGVTTDELCFKRKNKYPYICENDRAEIVLSIKYVDEVIMQRDMDKFSVAKKYGVDAVFVGSDWKDTETWIKYEQDLAKINCDVVYIEHTDGISSTLLRERLKNE